MGASGCKSPYSVLLAAAMLLMGISAFRYLAAANETVLSHNTATQSTVVDAPAEFSSAIALPKSLRLVQGLLNISASMIYHLHIQKVGGIALSWALTSDNQTCRCQYNRMKKDNYIALPNACKCKQVKLQNNNTQQVVATWLGIGHTFGLHPDMSAIDVSLNWQPGSRANGIFHDLTCCGKADDVAVVTMLREPLARAISEYNHCNSSVMAQACWGHPIIGLDIDDFIALPSSHYSVNRQMKMVSGCLEMAKLRIATFAFVGLSEQLKFFVQELSLLFGRPLTLPPPDYDTHSSEKAVLSKRAVPPPKLGLLTRDQVAKFEQREQYDIEFYAYTRTLLCERYHTKALCG